jgi:hypothetical protein
MILEAAALASRNEFSAGSSSRNSRPATPRVADDREVAKPFLAAWARNHPLLVQGGWVPADPATEEPADGSGSETPAGSVRQLALRAIFGIDRELNEREILERAGQLPGVRQLTRVADHEVEALDCARRAFGSMRFAGEPVKLVCGDAPVHFIAEGKVRLLVQASGSFAPGVRETLLIAARELDCL